MYVLRLTIRYLLRNLAIPFVAAVMAVPACAEGGAEADRGRADLIAAAQAKLAFSLIK